MNSDELKDKIIELQRENQILRIQRNVLFQYDELLITCEAVLREIDIITGMGRQCPFCGGDFHHCDTCIYERLTRMLLHIERKKREGSDD